MHCVHLKQLVLARCKRISDHGVATVLLERRDTLQLLDITGCDQLTDEAFLPLANVDVEQDSAIVQDLQKLKIDEKNAAISDITSRLPIPWEVATSSPGTVCNCNIRHPSPIALKHLHAEECTRLTGATLLCLAHVARSMRSVHLSYAKSIRGPAWNTLLAHQPYMHHLSVASCGKLTDADVEQWMRHAYHVRALKAECNYGRVSSQTWAALVERLAWSRLEELHIGGPFQMANTTAAGAWSRQEIFTTEELQALREKYPQIRIRQRNAGESQHVDANVSDHVDH
jgi:hypothetical protein